MLPHEVGMGTLSFTHPHNQRTKLQQKREEEAVITSSTITTSISDSSLTVEQEETAVHCHHHNNEDIDLTLAHDIKQLHINDESIVASSNSTGVEETNIIAPTSPDDKGTTNDVVAFNIPVTSSTGVQPTRQFLIATAAVGSHSYCTSVFIDVVEWLSPLIVGCLDGKVQVVK